MAQQDSSQICESSCCNNEVALPAGVMLGHVHSKGEWMLSYRYMNMAMKGIYQGNSSVTSDEVFKTYLMTPESMQMNMHMLMLMYGINKRLTLMAMVNYNQNTMNMTMFGMSDHHDHGMGGSNIHQMNSQGLGDVKLYGIYSLVNETRHKLLMNIGFSIPTGSIDVLGESNGMTEYIGKHLSYMMQLGSGTFDFLPGATYLYHKKTYTFGVQGNANIHLGYNKYGYSRGNEFTGNAWYAYRWLNFLSSSLRVEYAISGKIQGVDTSLYRHNEPSANTANYGGQTASVFIGTTWQPLRGGLKNQKISAEFGLPLYQNLNGIQSPIKYSINAYWALTF
ncbi:MAG: transporter [Bacteroidetes bacterium]|nr:transporter [Bacteroidota bacterium]